MQGNSRGPITWAVISTLAVEVLYNQGYRVILTTLITKEFTRQIESIFIDDTNLVEGKLNSG